MRIFGKLLPVFRLTRRISCNSIAPRHLPFCGTSNFLQTPCVKTPRFVFATLRFFGTKSGNSKFFNRKIGRSSRRLYDRNKSKSSDCLTKTSQNNVRVNDVGNILPVALINQTNVSSVKILLIPINIFEGEDDSVEKTLATLSVIRDNARQIEAFTHNLPSTQYLTAGAVTNTNSENKKKFNGPISPKSNVQPITETPILNEYDAQDDVTFWQTPDAPTEHGKSETLASYDELEKSVAEQEVNRLQMHDSFDVSTWNDSKRNLFAPVSQSLEEKLQTLPISSMQLAFEMDMTNIKDALLRASMEPTKPHEKVEGVLAKPKEMRNLKEPTLALTTCFEITPAPETKKVPLSFNALIQGVVEIDASRISLEELKNIKVPQFNECITAIAANICSTALKKGFPADCCHMSFSTATGSGSGDDKISSIRFGNTEGPRNALTGSTPSLNKSESYSTKSNQPKARNPHVVCVRDGKKGCVSPGNKDLPMFVSSKSASSASKSATSAPKEDGSKCQESKGLLMSCKAYANAIAEAAKRREATKNASKGSCQPKKKPSKTDCAKKPAVEKKVGTDPCKKSDDKKPKEGKQETKKKSDPCKSGDKKAAEKKKDPCKKADDKKDPCKSGDKKAEAKKKDSCKSDEKKKDPCKSGDKKPEAKKKDSCKSGDKKKDPCKSGDKKTEAKKKDPCKSADKKKDPCKSGDKKGDAKKKDPCKKSGDKKKDPCKKSDDKKKDPCKKSDDKKKDPCKKSGDKKKDPCKKSDDKKKDPCKKSGDKKKDPCKKSDDKKKDPCKKSDDKKKDPCKKSDDKKKDPCKKSDDKKKDPCKKSDDKKKDPCKKSGDKKKDPCKKSDDKKKDPCKKSGGKKADGKKADKKPSCGSVSKKPSCGSTSSSSSKKTKKNPCEDSKKSKTSKSGDKKPKACGGKDSKGGKDKKSDKDKKPKPKGMDPCKNVTIKPKKSKDAKSDSKKKEKKEKPKSSGPKCPPPKGDAKCKDEKSGSKGKKGKSGSDDKEKCPNAKSSGSGGSTKPNCSKKGKGDGKSKDKKSDSCKSSKSKESVSKKSNPCKSKGSDKKDKKDSKSKCGGGSGSKKSDPCKSKGKKDDKSKKSDPCKSKDKKDKPKKSDSCKKSGDKKSDPCKKSFSTEAFSTTEDPCKKSFSTEAFSTTEQSLLQRCYNVLYFGVLKRSISSISLNTFRLFSSKDKKDKKDFNNDNKCRHGRITKRKRRDIKKRTKPMNCNTDFDDCPKKTCKNPPCGQLSKKKKLAKCRTVKSCKTVDAHCYPGKFEQSSCPNDKKENKNLTNRIYHHYTWLTFGSVNSPGRQFSTVAIRSNNKNENCEDEPKLKKSEINNEILRITDLCQISTVPETIPKFSEYDVLIRTDSVAISETDLHVFETGGKMCPGVTLGHDASGIIVKVGKCIQNLKPGDRVVVESGLSCGICDFCKRGEYNICSQMIYNGFLAKYQVHPADLCHKLPDSVSMEEGCLAGLLALGCNACYKAPIKPTSNVLVLGSCPTAISAALCCQAIGSNRVCFACTHDKNLELIQKTFDFDCVCYEPNTRFQPLLESIYELLRCWPDVVINCAISGTTMDLSVMSLLSCGTCVLAKCDTECASFNAMEVLMKNLRIIPSFRSTNMYPTALQLMDCGLAPMGELISECFTWEAAQTAFQTALHESNTGNMKVIVKCADKGNYKEAKT